MEKVILNFACPLKLADFDKTASGFHCGMCKKSIVDFRGKTKTEVDSYRAQHKTENVCGLFHKDQVVDVAPDFYEPSPSFFRAPLHRRIQLVMVICFATILFSCKDEVQPHGKALTVWDKVNDLETNFSREQVPEQMLQTNSDSLEEIVFTAPDIVNGDISEPLGETMGEIVVENPEPPAIDNNSPLCYAAQMPEFPGGIPSLYKFIGANLDYPKQAIEQGLQGKIYIRFVVKKDGTASEPVILRGIGMEDEFMKSISNLLSAMPKWKPGMQSGNLVDVYFTLPLNFVLPDALSKETESKEITKNSVTEKPKQRDESGLIIYPKRQR
ncbi:MAG: energy transducer TonB [Bacteroidia bacterium]|nr:energy transducer TonB [Bacteroidia bacterium]